MDHKAVVKLCTELGCCDACALRYIGLKNPTAYENSSQFILKYQDQQTDSQKQDTEKKLDKVSTEPEDTNNSGDGSTPPCKRRKMDACISCLGVLQPWSWDQCCEIVKEELDKKGYACPTFACALSAPMATLLREKYVTLQLASVFPEYDSKVVTPLKEAWKWSFGIQLSRRVGRQLDSGAVCPLLVTITVDYPDDLQELEILKTLASSLFESRSRQKKRFTVELTRRSVEQALEGVTLPSLQAAGGAKEAARALSCSVSCTHAPAYLGGRYALILIPKGYDTMLGGAGAAALSGGQKQRVALARALCRAPRLLLLDEATSALDAATENAVQAALEAAAAGRTTVMIAHRLATVARAHVIAVVDRGVVAEQGSHEQLVRKRGLYWTLLQQQAGTH